MPPHTYTCDLRIRLHDTDAAGVLFFGHLFRHAHDAYESFMEHIGFPLHEMIGTGGAPSLPLPITRAEARYLSPMHQGDAVRIELRVGEVRTRSFALDYRFLDDLGHPRAEARTVHCVVGGDDATLPDGLRRALTERVETP